jgi:hypothetical protein
MIGLHGWARPPLVFHRSALLFRPPAALATMDLLPTALSDAWTKEAEPKTTVSALYTDLKAKRGRPWPTKLFLDGLNAALGQGFRSPRQRNWSAQLSAE